MLHAVAAEPASATPGIQRQRADKIVGTLGLTDGAQAARVRDIIIRQYADLSVIHATRDAALQAAKAGPSSAKPAAEAAARDAAAAAQDALHPQYLARLAAELTPAQVEQVKDGMTYGVLPLTFRVYQEMLPDLTAEQKAQILDWLAEAREHAMDASTSDEKHAWFGKFKGRINNYLAKAGIDMKQAEKDMLARKKAGNDQGPKT
jgi:Spy/CpxP family protein refolding chaperone